MQKLLFILGLLTSISSFALTRFATNLDCSGTSITSLVVGASEYECINPKNDKRYRVEAVGIALGIAVADGNLSLPIYSINPLGSIEGYYYGVDASVGYESGIRGGVFAGEFGTKWIPIGDIVNNDEMSSLHSLDIRAMQFHIKEIEKD